MSMAFRTCPECRWNKVGYYCGKQFTLNGFECINFDKKEKKVIKKDPHKDSEVRQDQLEYLKLKYLYEGEPIDYLDARVPFHYKDVKYQSMDINDYIAMVEEIEKVSPLLAKSLGASCQFGPCPEGSMCCMMPYEKKNK